MSFQVALTGLDAAQTNLDVISNNIANSNTAGFKRSRAEFADVYASSALGTVTNATGEGVRVTNIRQQHTQGDINYTENNLDIAISGGGLFRLKDSDGSVVFSRAGAFGLDREGYISNATEQRLTGYQVDDKGTILPTLGELQIDRADLQPSATDSITMVANLDQTTEAIGSLVDFSAGDPKSYNFSTGATVIDSQGSSHVVNYYFRKDTDSLWSMYIESADTDTLVGDTEGYSIKFDTGGRIEGMIPNNAITTDATVQANKTALITAQADLATAEAALSSPPLQAELDAVALARTAVTTAEDALILAKTDAISVAIATDSMINQDQNGTPQGKFSVQIDSTALGSSVDAIELDIDVAAITQFDAASGINSIETNGFSSGRLTSLDIDKSGIVFGRYTNGQSQAMGQIALANFPNLEGLNPVGDSAWAETYASGLAIVGAPGSASLGFIQSSALEQSNVNITEELVDMIGAQRSFQANAQTISAADTLTQTIINMSR